MILLFGSVGAAFGVSAPCDDFECYWGENKLVMKESRSHRTDQQNGDNS